MQKGNQPNHKSIVQEDTVYETPEAAELSTAPLAHVALPLPLRKAFSYSIPSSLEADAVRGARVLVPFGKRFLTGLIVDIETVQTLSKRTKPLHDVLDDKPAFTPEMLALTKWISEYYVCGWGEVIRAALPSGIDQEQQYLVSLQNASMLHATPDRLRPIVELLKTTGAQYLTDLKKEDPTISLSFLRRYEKAGWLHLESSLKRPKVRIKKAKHFRFLADHQTEEALAEKRAMLTGNKQQAVFDAMVELTRQGQLEPAQAEILSHTGASSATLTSLVKKGLLEIIEKEVIRTPLGDIPAEPDLPPRHTLHKSQDAALERISQAIEAEKFETFLLHGVTGSGKTEVYIAALKDVLGRGKTGIVLVPEIALTPQTVSRFRAHFGDRIAVLHSRMSKGERYDAWRNLRNGRYDVVIGPRSAILAPLENIGLIVVDEEHESSYKQFDPAPRYHARDVAVMRAHNNKAVCILGSATPSLESYVNATETGKYTYLSMPDRVPVPGHEAAPLPDVRIVDLTLEKRKHRLPGVLSEALKQAISERLAASQQVILLQNRRGYSSILLCETCGWSPMCSDCAVTQTYHKVKHHLRCHYCGKTERVTRKCPQCGGLELSRLGAGTQRIEEELEAYFPEARLARMDLDTTSAKNAHYKILDRFAKGESDILIGTQMVAKGLDFGNVTLVGVINADVGMLLPDFRAEERTFQLLTQVAGRAGRAGLRGEVLLQTRNPKHPVLRFAANHDYNSFARVALSQRRELSYPPYGRVIRIEFKGPDEEVVGRLARQWTSGLPKQEGIQIMGPQAAFIGRIQKQYRFQVMLKAQRHIPMPLLRQMIEIATTHAGKTSREYRIAIDVDSVSL